MCHVTSSWLEWRSQHVNGLSLDDNLKDDALNSRSGNGSNKERVKSLTRRLPAGDDASLLALSRHSAYALTYSLHSASNSSTGKSAICKRSQSAAYRCLQPARAPSEYQPADT